MDPQNLAPAETEGAANPDPVCGATQMLTIALQNLNAQFQAMNAKIDLIVAAVEGDALQANASPEPAATLRNKVSELEKANHDLKAQSDRARRKTLSPMVSSLLAKGGVEGDALIEAPVVEKALAGLTIEQRIAVKAELARAGVLV